MCCAQIIDDSETKGYKKGGGVATSYSKRQFPEVYAPNNFGIGLTNPCTKLKDGGFKSVWAVGRHSYINQAIRDNICLLDFEIE